MSRYLNDNRYNYTEAEFLNLPNELKINPDFVLKCLEKNGELLKIISDEFRRNLVFIKTAIQNDPSSYKYIPPHILENLENIMDLLHTEPGIFLYMERKYRCNRNVILAAIEYFGVDALGGLCKNLAQDVEIIFTALKSPYGQEYWEVLGADDDLDFSKKLVKKAIEIFGDQVRYRDLDWIKSQKEIIEFLSNN